MCAFDNEFPLCDWQLDSVVPPSRVDGVHAPKTKPRITWIVQHLQTRAYPRCPDEFAFVGPDCRREGTADFARAESASSSHWQFIKSLEQHTMAFCTSMLGSRISCRRGDRLTRPEADLELAATCLIKMPPRRRLRIMWSSASLIVPLSPSRRRSLKEAGHRRRPHRGSVCRSRNRARSGVPVGRVAASLDLQAHTCRYPKRPR